MQQQGILEHLCRLRTPQARWRPLRADCIWAHLSPANSESDTQQFKEEKSVKRSKYLKEPSY